MVSILALAAASAAIAQTSGTPLPPRILTTPPATSGGAAPGSSGAAGATQYPSQYPSTAVTPPAQPTSAGAPRSVINWIDRAIEGDPTALTPPGAGTPGATPGALDGGPGSAPGLNPGASDLGPDASAASPDLAPSIRRDSADPAASGQLPGRAPRVDGLPGSQEASQPGPRPTAGAQPTPSATSTATQPSYGQPPYRQPGASTMPDAGPFAAGRAPRALPGDPNAIETAPIDAISDASAGVIPADDAGMPVGAWGRTVEGDAAALVEDLRPGPLTSVNRFAIRLMSVALEPPAYDSSGADLLATRIETLTRFGAAETAVRVAEAAGPARLVQAAEPALISGRDSAFCETLSASEGPGSVERIYCQGVLGDRYGALAAIDVSRTLGDAAPGTLELLEAVADPDLASYVSAPTQTAALTPIELAAARRLRLALPPDFARAAPLSMVPAAAAPEATPRLQLEALERLEQAGAIDTETLATRWNSQSSAESGGVWGRLEAYRAALSAPDAGFAAAVSVAAQRAREAGKLDVMARLLGKEIAARAFPRGGAPAPGLNTEEIRTLLRLAGEGDAASALLSQGEGQRRAAGPEERALDWIAAAYPSTQWDPADASALLASAARGDRAAGRMMAALNALGAQTMAPDFFEGPQDLSFDKTEGRVAPIAFRALIDLGRGGDDIAPETLYQSMQRLIALGFAREARQIATEAIILGR